MFSNTVADVWVHGQQYQELILRKKSIKACGIHTTHFVKIVWENLSTCVTVLGFRYTYLANFTVVI